MIEDSPPVRGVRVPDLEPATLYDACRDLLSRYEEALLDADRAVVLPDARYPHHPSTGMVTDPATVQAILRALEALAGDVPTTLAIASGSRVDSDQVARYLGYDDVAERTGARLISTEYEPAVDRTVSVGARGVRVSIPEPLDEALVLNVPTLRLARATTIAGAMVNLSRPTEYADVSTGPGIAAAVSALSPTITVLDGTYAFVGEPHEARAILASGDPVSIDRAITAALGIDPSKESYLRITGGMEDVNVAGLSIERLAEELPEGAMPERDDAHPLLRAGYRAYAKVSGDAVPPQMMEDN